MKKLLLLFFLFSSLFANFGFQADLLYMAPSFDETYFVINGRGTDGRGNPIHDGKRINNSLGYNFGFRLEGRYGFPNSCVDLGVRWTHLFATSKKSVVNGFPIPQLWATEIIPSQQNIPQPYSGRASSKIDVMYQKGEVLADERLWSLSCWKFALREAVEWSYIRYHELVKYKTLANLQQQLHYHGHTKGLGPQLGLIAICEPVFCFWPQDLSLHMMVTGSLIAANTKCKVSSQDVSGASSRVTQQSFWRFVPEVHYHFGIHYDRLFCYCATSLEIGYEVTTYLRGISKLLFDEGAFPGLSFNQYSDFYVHGLYLAGNIYF